MMTLLAALSNIGGGGLIGQLLAVLIVALCAGVVYLMGRFFIKKFFAETPRVMDVWNGFFILVGGIIVINFLLSLLGHGFVAW